MKSILCKKPMISAISINLITITLYLYAINQKLTYFSILVILSGLLNRYIITNGINLTSHKKSIIFISCFFMIGVALIYASYVFYFK
jgi:hypothetical protein